MLLDARIEALELELKKVKISLRGLVENHMRPSPEYAGILGTYGPVVHDKGCNEPIGWGFPILRELTEEETTDLKRQGDIDWVGDGTYALVIRWLKPEEAEELYGPRGDVTRGPRGGFHQVIYGAKAFNHRKMDPEPKAK